ncbi:hypothetical protein L465_00413 [Enterobacter sp. BIDMC 29]|uniref:hypothetical protein n=1 Tax=Enterobacter sp. BIDMC 29 TaxID=1329841 RepID=UPI0004493123|nr:hypothetical protein [Enterobacter sp. BIDMC 29]EUM16599.1 hypothetical protein L465_00413 [Enterobacter sp. BIDMC 29]
MKTKLIISNLVLIFLSSGCAVENDRTDVGVGLAYHSNISKNTDGTYTAAVEASPLRGRISGAQALVTQDAVEKCHTLNKGMKVVKDETESHLLINGVARLTFKCI